MDLEAFGLGRYALSSPALRRKAIDALLPRIKYLSLADRQQEIARLQTISGVARLPTDLMMRSQQVRDLHHAGMEIGAHTVNHPILAAIDAAEAEHEIQQGKQALEAILDSAVDVLAYPNGKPDRDYDSSHVAMARRLGFRGAVSTAPGAAHTGDDLFQLPRFTPWDTSMPRWALRLWLNQRSSGFDRAAP